MTPQAAIDHFGGRAALADALGVTVSRVQQWAVGGSLPLRQVARLVILTKGAVPCAAATIAAIKIEAALYGRATKIIEGKQ